MKSVTVTVRRLKFPPLQADFASGKVTLLTYLRDLYPNDWEHFKERVARMALDKAHREAEISVRLKDGYEGITELDFAAGNVLAPWALELQLWASYRAQVYDGMMAS